MRAGIIKTHSGLYVNLQDPDPATIVIADIAHALSNLCRFTGHTCVFYSVAQHSVLGANVTPLPHSRAFLLHDAAEAYISDMSAPLKQLPEMQDYRRIEEHLLIAIAGVFGVNFVDADIHEIDQRMRATEQRDLMGSDPAGGPFPPYSWRIVPWTPDEARETFLDLYYALTPTMS
mgnify:CR=1 FL=1